MWLLENDGDVFGGRRLWLRPGKTYLFGRTSIEPGTLVVSDKTISRKHITIRVDNVKDGDGQNRLSRSTVTIEDLKTKIGTLVNGVQIKGTSHVITQPTNEIKLGHYSKLFRLSWNPIVLSFSFTTRELQSDPWAKLRQDFEQLDIKYIPDYDLALTTHVVSKKRNTSKGLQALINGRYIVMDTFLQAVLDAARPVPGDAGSQLGPDTSRLEEDFDVNWPNPLDFLSPRGDEPGERPPDAYAPDRRRAEVFDGYTFIFIDKAQHDNLAAAITNGNGKALLRQVVPGETEVDDFVRYVKEVAGEKGLGEFEGGSEGKGVVVVRWAPPRKVDTFDWYVGFITSVSLRLDHRMIDQREFLDAILANQAGMLRRPLETETEMLAPAQRQPQPQSSSARAQARSPARAAAAGGVAAPAAPDTDVMDVVEAAVVVEAPEATPPEREDTPPRRTRGRRGRFRGFDRGDDEDEAAEEPPRPPPSPPQPQSQDMFVSQVEPQEETNAAAATRRATRKRGAPVVPAEQEVAPAAAAVKRRRIAAGEDLTRRPARGEDGGVDAVAPEPPPAPAEESAAAGGAGTAPAAATAGGAGGRGKKKGAIDSAVLDHARLVLEEREARAKEETERLAQLPEDGVDAVEIRRLTIVEDMEVRRPPGGGGGGRTRTQDVAEGRWDPKWNGRQNFKKFRKQGQAVGLPARRVIVGYEEAKNKAYGIGDDYWLEDEPSQRGGKRKDRDKGVQSQASAPESSSSKAMARTRAPHSRRVVDSDGDSNDNEVANEVGESDILELDEDEDDAAEDSIPGMEAAALPRTKKAKAAEKANLRESQSRTQPRGLTDRTTQDSVAARKKTTTAAAPTRQSQRATRASASTGGASARSSGKRPAATPPRAAPAAKKPRREVADSDDDSDEEEGGGFRWGRR